MYEVKYCRRQKSWPWYGSNHIYIT